MSIYIACIIGVIAGVIGTKLYFNNPIIGTIHIELDTDNSGEMYRFSFNDFDKARKSNIVRMKIEDHTH